MKYNIKQGSSTKQGLSGILWNFSGSIVQILAQFVVISVLARLLAPEDFGVVGVILIFVNFSNIFTDLGIATAIIQLKNISREHISCSYTISLTIGLLVGFLFYFTAPELAEYFQLKDASDAIRFFAIFFPLKSLNSISNALLSRNLRFSVIVKSHIIAYLLGIGLTSIVLANLDFGYWALIYGQFAGLLLTVLMMMYFEPPRFGLRFKRKTIKELLFFGSGHTMGTVFTYFGENADNIIIGKSLGTVALGLYSKAFQLFSIPATFFGSVYDKVLFPILALKQNDKNLLVRFYLFSTSLCLGILFPLAVLLFINAELIIKILLGDQWYEAIYLFQILVIGLAYRFGTRINKSYLKAMGIIYRGAYYQFVFAILMFGFGFVGAYYYKLPGLAYGVFLATLINYLQMSYRLFKELNFDKFQFLKIQIIPLILNAPFFLVTLLLRNFEFTSIWLHFGLSIFIYTPIMVAMIINRRNVIFNNENDAMLHQIYIFLPIAIRNKLTQFGVWNKQNND